MKLRKWSRLAIEDYLMVFALVRFTHQTRQQSVTDTRAVDQLYWSRRLDQRSRQEWQQLHARRCRRKAHPRGTTTSHYRQ